jgi:hypothetical protein
MIFYHFTCRAALKSIRKQGLLPSNQNFGFEAGIDIPTPPSFPVVWLTQTQLKTASGVFANPVSRDVRIKIKVPVKTKALWHWPTWLQRFDPEFLQLMMDNTDPTSHPAWPYYWFYIGTITPDKFKSIDAAPVTAISEERRQELLAEEARIHSLVDGMLKKFQMEKESLRVIMTGARGARRA